MKNYTKRLKIVLFFAIVLTFASVVLSIYSSTQNLNRYKEHILTLGKFVIRSFESGNRAFMRNMRFADSAVEKFASEIAGNKLIENILIYRKNGEVVLSVNKNQNVDTDYLLQKDTEEITFSETDRFFFIYKEFDPFGNMPGHMRGMGGMMGRNMHNSRVQNTDEKMYIGIILDREGYKNRLRESVVYNVQTFILGLLILIIFFYSVKIIDEYERKNRQLKNAEKEAELGKFANVLAHEIKNPLSSMKGLVKFSSSRVENKDIADYLNRSVEEVDRLNKIVNDFLSYGRTLTLEPAPAGIKDIMDSTINLLKYDLDRKNLSVTYIGESFSINADKDKLIQAFMNIIINAVHASPENDCIEVKFQKSNKKVLVQNNVHGEPDIDMDKIFEPFYSSKSKGSGLGMAIAKKIMILHNGDIRILGTSPFIVELDFSKQKDGGSVNG